MRYCQSSSDFHRYIEGFENAKLANGQWSSHIAIRYEKQATCAHGRVTSRSQASSRPNTCLKRFANTPLHLEQLDSPSDPAARELFDRELSPDRRNLDLAYFTLRSMKHTMRDAGMSVSAYAPVEPSSLAKHFSPRYTTDTYGEFKLERNH